jgi:hypothetical protein
MAYEIKDKGNILKYATPGSYVCMAATITNTGLSADGDGKKIVLAGTALEVDVGTSIRGAYGTAKKCATGANAEAILFTDVDVTDGSVTGSILIKGIVDGAKLESMPTGTVAALKPFGINVIGAYTEA